MAKTSTLDLPSFYRSTVGFDRIFDEMNRQFSSSAQSGYPPYNVIQRNDDEYLVELAVAGFTMDELDVTKEKDILRIKGEAFKDSGGNDRYLHHGIAKRNFTREFTLADHVDVVGASLENGMLTVHLKREIPEADLPKQISISTGHTGTGALESNAE